MNKRVLFIDTVHPALNSQLEQNNWECIDASSWNQENTLNALPEFSGIVIRSRMKLDKPALDRCTALKFIARAGAGMENIDVEYAESKGIACLNAPEGNRNAVADHAMGLLLSLMNRLVIADREVREGIWLREENRGTEIEGKTIGIIGFGNTGSSFAKKLTGFDCRILAYDPYIEIDSLKFPNVTQVNMEEIFSESDILSLHVPLTSETSQMINKKYLNNFKKSIFLINTSRGKVVSTTAVVNAIESKKIKGAALDVLEFESLSFEQLSQEQLPESFKKLITFENVILSPHIAGWTFESHRKISEVLAKKILDLKI